MKDFTTFPYKARSLTLNKEIEFNSVEDVYEELFRCYDKAFNNYPIGQSLFVSHLFYCSPIIFYDHKIQNRIKKVQYSLESNTPLYTTVNNTPASVVDEFMIFRHESEHCKSEILQKQKKEQKVENGSKKQIHN